MRTRPRTTLATLPLALLLVVGCSAEESPADGDAATTEPTAEATEGATEDATATEDGATEQDSAVTFDSLSGEATRLTVDQAYVDALNAVGAQLSAVGGAQTETGGGGTTFVFPVTGGQATVDPEGADPFTGTVQHEGGLQLSALGRSVTIEGLVLDGEQDQVTATVAGRPVTLLPLSMSDAQITQSDDQVVIQDNAVSFDAETTNALAEQLGLPVTLPAINVGSLEVTLAGS